MSLAALPSGFDYALDTSTVGLVRLIVSNTPLTAYDVNYSCPADGKPVEHGGECTRCDMNARETMAKAPVVETAKATAKK